MASYWDVYLAVRSYGKPVTADEIGQILDTDRDAIGVALILLQGVELVYRTSDVGPAAGYAVGGRAKSDVEARALAAGWGLELTGPVGAP